MNVLPDMIVLEFCEWLKSSINKNHSEYDFLDLLLDEQYRPELRSYADKFLEFYPFSIKKIFHQYIESEYFEESLERCGVYNNKIDIKYFRELCLDGLVHHYFHKGNFGQSISQFIRKIYRIHSYELVDSIVYLFSRVRTDEQFGRKKEWIFQFINSLDLNLDVEVDFLEWFMDNNSTYVDIRKMPLKTFEIIADRFKVACEKDEQEKQKLIKSFKQSDLKVLFDKLISILPRKTVRRAKDLGYIIDRYQDKKVRYKCIIMPRQADTKEYKDLIEKRWIDLHDLSGNYLDIYYTDTDYGKSGYEIMNRMKYVPDDLKTKAPIIVIWEDDLRKAQSIDIRRLSNEDIFDVIQCIVDLIRKGQSIDKIVEEANCMSEELRDRQRAVTHNTVKIIGGTVNGPVSAVNEGEMYTVFSDNTGSSKLLLEIEKVKEIISDFDEIEESYKKRLTEIVDEAKDSIKKNSEEEQEKSKKSFRDAIFFMGNAGSKLIAALSGLANVLEFFGVSPTLPV